MKYSSKIFEKIVQNTFDGLIIISADGIITLFNPAAQNIFGYSQQEVMGKNITMLMPESSRNSHDNSLKRYVSTGVSNFVNKEAVDITGRKKNGETFPMKLAVNTIEIDGKSYFLGVVENISSRKKHEEELKMNFDRFSYVEELAYLINNALDMREIYQHLVIGLKEILNVNRLTITAFDQSKRSVDFLLSHNMSEKYTQGAERIFSYLGTDDPFTDMNLPPTTIPDLLECNDDFPKRKILLKEGIHSVYSIVLSHRNKPLGRFSVFYDEPHHYTDEEKTLLKAISRHLSFVLARQALEEQREKLLRVIKTANEINQLIVKEKELELLLSKACDILVRTGGYELSWVGLITAGSGYDVKPVAKAGAMDYVDKIKVKWDESRHGNGPTGTAIKTQKSVICNINSDNDPFRPWYDTAKKYGFMSMAAIPLVNADKVFGSLQFYSKDPAKFDEDEMRLLQELTDDIAFAIWSIEEENKLRYAQIAVKETNDKFHNFFCNNPEACNIKTADGFFLDVNQAFVNMMGYSKEEILGQNVKNMDIWASDEERERINKELFTTGFINNREFKFRTKEGNIRHGLFSAQIIETHNEVSILSMVKDITHEKEIEDELKKAKDTAISANRSKSEFLATMSHEIRTPMNSIIGMADLLAETNLSPEQSEYIDIFRKSGEHLLDLINDILDLSKIEAGQVELESAGFDLYDLINKVENLFEHRTKTKSLNIGANIDADIPILKGDSGRLNQVLINLTGNAIKFTHVGGIFINVKNTGISNKNGKIKLLFEVKDTGIGIPANKINRIFERFSQADSSTTRQYGGTGLGLTISKKLVELMGGNIWVESISGKGSSFFFDLEFSMAKKEETLNPVPAELVTHSARISSTKPLSPLSRKILLVEDSEDNRQLIRLYLKNHPYDIDIAENGHIAVEKFKSNDYHLILMDIQMPVMDGYRATSIIRDLEYEYNKRPVPIIALTANAFKEDEHKCLLAGCSSYLSKPVKKKLLIEHMESHFNMN